MRILLTGATGYIGGRVAERLIEEGHEVYCVVRHTSKVEELQQYAEHIIAFQENIQLYSIMAQAKPELVIHIAGKFCGQHSASNIEQMLESNITFPTILLDAAERAGCRKILNTSSFWQNYDKEIYNPVNLYAAMKQSFEDIIMYYTRCRGFCALSLQLFEVYGAGDRRKKVLNCVRELKEGEELSMSPGRQKLYMCYIEDVVNAFLRAVDVIGMQQKGTYEKYAVRDKEPYFLQEIIETYLRISKKKVCLKWGDIPYPDRIIMNPEGLGEVLPGWRPNYSLEEGMKQYCKGEQTK